MVETQNSNNRQVRHFRQIFLWPLQLMPIREGAQIQNHWELLQKGGPDNPWHELQDEFTGDPGEFKLRHYNEFVSFLPYVQRFIYGESRAATPGSDPRASSMRVFRRDDIGSVRVTASPGDAPLLLSVAHVDLYFFYDVDVVLLNMEVFADELPLRQVQELLYRFGRTYPANWTDAGDGEHCMHRVEWLAADGSMLAVSDYEKRDKYLSFVCRHRAACIASHWAFLMRPLVLDHFEEKGLIRYRQLEYYRMPLMAYLAVDNPRALPRADLIRLALATGSGDTLPFADQHLADFDSRFCYDRYWCDSPDIPSTRFMSCGHTLVVVGDAQSKFFTGREAGVLAQFRHQYFLVFMIAHLQKAALLMFSDRLVEALNSLDIQNTDTVRRFKRAIRQTFEIFLRFTHRYWFHELSDQAQTKALFKLTSEHLGTDALFAEVKQEIHDMSQYLDSDSLRRQANTAIRLVVVTTFGLIGTVVTGFLGMNLISYAEAPLINRALFFFVVAVPTIWLTFYTIYKSKRLSDFLEALSDENLPAGRKFSALLDVWRRHQSD
ncbi:MAG: hypothetical protein ACRETN_14045 [Nevskiales bacterium]